MAITATKATQATPSAQQKLQQIVSAAPKTPVQTVSPAERSRQLAAQDAVVQKQAAQQQAAQQQAAQAKQREAMYQNALRNPTKLTREQFATLSPDQQSKVSMAQANLAYNIGLRRDQTPENYRQRQINLGQEPNANAPYDPHWLEKLVPAAPVPPELKSTIDYLNQIQNPTQPVIPVNTAPLGSKPLWADQQQQVDAARIAAQRAAGNAARDAEFQSALTNPNNLLDSQIYKLTPSQKDLYSQSRLNFNTQQAPVQQSGQTAAPTTTPAPAQTPQPIFNLPSPVAAPQQQPTGSLFNTTPAASSMQPQFGTQQATQQQPVQNPPTGLNNITPSTPTPGQPTGLLPDNNSNFGQQLSTVQQPVSTQTPAMSMNSSSTTQWRQNPTTGAWESYNPQTQTQTTQPATNTGIQGLAAFAPGASGIYGSTAPSVL